MTNYTKIWETHNGPIPFDDLGRRFHIHHKDGNKKNNKIENFLCLSAQDHYNLHYKQGDYFECHLIAKNHLNLSKEDFSNLAKLSGELHRNTISVKDKNGNKFRVANTDYRFLSGELVGVTKGMVSAKWIESGETISLSSDEFRQGRDAGLLEGITANIPLSNNHKSKVSLSLTGIKRSEDQKINYRLGAVGRKRIIHISGRKSWAYPIKSLHHQISIDEVGVSLEWDFG